MKTITICASATFYRQAVEIEEQLRQLGFTVLLPHSAIAMKEANDFTERKTWLNNPDDYHVKTDLMRRHFEKVRQGDAILVINLEKHGIPGYIGGNVLMEMAIAFEAGKPIYIYNPITDDFNLREEVYGLEPIFINQDLQRIQ